jgi:replicative DNA helicase
MLEAAAVEAEGLTLHLNSQTGMTVAMLRTWARRLKRQGGLDLLVIDYLGLLSPRAGTKARGLYEIVTEISKDLMNLKGELGIPILALAQLSRGPESARTRSRTSPTCGTLARWSRTRAW